ncbi:MAG: hypothetical protein PHO08_07540 [Methylococcales bacterium]|nr:hypothetical protein [Methylococcales bacterium]MDD5632439.1 hypothetical protein [Methylococcales bacterium]
MGQREFRNDLPCLEKADTAPIRPQSGQSDLKLKESLKHRLKAAKKQIEEQDDFFRILLPTFAKGRPNSNIGMFRKF